jgi:hypothetical protein
MREPNEVPSARDAALREAAIERAAEWMNKNHEAVKRLVESQWDHALAMALYIEAYEGGWEAHASQGDAGHKTLVRRLGAVIDTLNDLWNDAANRFPEGEELARARFPLSLQLDAVRTVIEEYDSQAEELLRLRAMEALTVSDEVIEQLTGTGKEYGTEDTVKGIRFGARWMRDFFRQEIQRVLNGPAPEAREVKP